MHVVEAEVVPLHAEQDGGDTVVGLQPQRQGTGHVGLAVGEFFGIDRFIAQPLELVEDAVYGQVDVGRVDARHRHPRADAQIGVKGAVTVVGQPLLLAHNFAQPPHQAKAPQDVVRHLYRIIIWIRSGNRQAANHNVRLDFAGHGGHFAAHLAVTLHRRDRPISRRALPVAQVLAHEIDGGIGFNVPADDDDGAVRRVALRVEIDQIVAGDGADRLGVARCGHAVGVIAVDRLAKATVGDAACALLALLQTHQPLSTHPFHLLRRENRTAQRIGQ